MNVKHEWMPISWFCSNCGNEVIGVMNSNQMVKVECNRCHVKMVRTIKGRRSDTIKLFAPEGETRLYM